MAPAAAALPNSTSAPSSRSAAHKKIFYHDINLEYGDSRPEQLQFCHFQRGRWQRHSTDLLPPQAALEAPEKTFSHPVYLSHRVRQHKKLQICDSERGRGSVTKLTFCPLNSPSSPRTDRLSSYQPQPWGETARKAPHVRFQRGRPERHSTDPLRPQLAQQPVARSSGIE